MNDSDIKVYNSANYLSTLVLVVGSCFFAFGVYGIYLEGLKAILFAGTFILMSLLALWGGSRAFWVKVFVDNRGITKTQFCWTIFDISWEDIESWSVSSDRWNEFPKQMVFFRTHGCGKSIVVTTWDVAIPGMEEFVNQIRKKLAKRIRENHVGQVALRFGNEGRNRLSLVGCRGDVDLLMRTGLLKWNRDAPARLLVRLR